jgi:hypothetical protein
MVWGLKKGSDCVFARGGVRDCDLVGLDLYAERRHVRGSGSETAGFGWCKTRRTKACLLSWFGVNSPTFGIDMAVSDWIMGCLHGETQLNKGSFRWLLLVSGTRTAPGGLFQLWGGLKRGRFLGLSACIQAEFRLVWSGFFGGFLVL